MPSCQVPLRAVLGLVGHRRRRGAAPARPGARVAGAGGQHAPCRCRCGPSSATPPGRPGDEVLNRRAARRRAAGLGHLRRPGVGRRGPRRRALAPTRRRSRSRQPAARRAVGARRRPEADERTARRADTASRPKPPRQPRRRRPRSRPQAEPRRPSSGKPRRRSPSRPGQGQDDQSAAQRQPVALRHRRRRLARGSAGDLGRGAGAGARRRDRIGEWIARLGEIWVDGQIAQLTRRPGVATQFLTLRDPDANISLTVTCARGVLPDTSARDRGSCCGPGRTSTSSAARSACARPRSARSASVSCWPASSRCAGCWPPRDCSPPTASGALPFLPGTIGLITGRASAAERDVVENARRRLPGARFRLENVAMQGANAVTEVVDALQRLDARPRRRRHRHRPRRRQRRGPAAVQQRDAGARGVGRPHARGQRDRARDRPPAARPGRRPGRVHADRRRQADRARPRRRDPR